MTRYVVPCLAQRVSCGSGRSGLVKGRVSMWDKRVERAFCLSVCLSTNAGDVAANVLQNILKLAKVFLGTTQVEDKEWIAF